MCGIVGLLLTQPGPVDLTDALRKLRHRGPDDQGELRWLPGEDVRTERDRRPCMAALGHVRLSILDLSPLGHQPMSTPDGRWHLIYNGEVYNHLELRSELEAQGVCFSSRSDTEVVLHALTTWGPERALPRFRGMFAMALLDTAERRMLLARDPFGIKPLFLARWRDGIAFASEIAPLLALPGVDRRLDAERCWHYLGFGATDHAERSLLSGIRQLPSGHWTWVQCGHPEPLGAFIRYWDPYGIQPIELPFDHAVERFRHLFLDSVRLHLRSDVPIGTALSGGLDSSAIICAIRHLEPRRELHTFSYLAEDKSIAEDRWVALVNDHIGAIAHPVRVGGNELSADLDRLLLAQGEPFGSTSIYAQYAVFRAARESGIGVMLDGQGADELLAGYECYQGARLASLLSTGRWPQALRLLQAQRHWPGRRPLRCAATAAGLLMPADLMPNARRLLGGTAAPAWIRRDWFTERGVTLAYPFRPKRRNDRLRASLVHDVSHHGLIQLLRYEDRNSMAWSVESRVPFLDVPLVGFALSLPESHLVGSDGMSKRILRAALRGIVPDAILDRRDKIGFATPESAWLGGQTALIDATIRHAAGIPCLDPDGVAAYCRSVASGHRPGDAQLWRLINFVAWHSSLDRT